MIVILKDNNNISKELRLLLICR